MSDPAISAARKVFTEYWPDQGDFEFNYSSEGRFGIEVAREMAKSVQEQLAVIRERYELVRTWMLAAETSAELSRHSSEMAGLKYAYDLIAPTVYPSEELER